MAATGLVLYGFVVAHMIGNLQVYLGPEPINAYGAFLHGFLHGQGLYLARAVLLLATALHVWAAVSLWRTNLKARHVGYREWQARESTYASRTMVWSGPLLLALASRDHSSTFFRHSSENSVKALMRRRASSERFVSCVVVAARLPGQRRCSSPQKL